MKWCWMLLVCILLSACGGGSVAPSPVSPTEPLAQVADFPATPDPLPIATQTDTVALAETPAPTETLVPTLTPAPTSTSAPTATPRTAGARKQRVASAPKPKPTNTPRPKPTATPTPVPEVHLYVDSDGYVSVNLREEPSTDSNVLLTVPYRARVEAAARPVRGADGRSWRRVEYRSAKGYVLGSLLSKRQPEVAPPPTPTPQPAPTFTPEPAESTVSQGVGVPVRFLINTDRVQVNAPVEYLAKTEDGAMAAPEGWWNVGWYRLGPAPGEPGNAVIAGHLDSESGPAVFWQLRELRIGDVVSVVDDRGNTISFRVTRTQVYYNNNAPIREIFGAADGTYLNLITCDGYFDPAAGIYDRRLVVFTERIW